MSVVRGLRRPSAEAVPMADDAAVPSSDEPLRRAGKTTSRIGSEAGVAVVRGRDEDLGLEGGEVDWLAWWSADRQM